MILVEEHRIKRTGHRMLFHEIDDYCYRAKNLSNSVQYLICQSFRIHRKLQKAEMLGDWEQDMLQNINGAILSYNASRPGKKELKIVDDTNGFIADAYFLSWYLKDQDIYKAMPYATCSQICIQEKCREWKAFYKALTSYAKDPSKFLGRPHRPGYLDSKKGRSSLVITSQNFSVLEDGSVRMPGFLSRIRIKARHQNARQIRILSKPEEILIRIMYEAPEETPKATGCVMGIDLGVDNLMTITFSSEEEPLIISGKPLKSMNQYYNKKKAELQSGAKKNNRSDHTGRIDRLTGKRNRKVHDYLHKASRKVVDLARKSGTRLIVIGNNRGWKQNVELGKQTNQTFVSIPYNTLIEMIRYKAVLAGIKVLVTEESYTSGSSYLDGELPQEEFYDKKRRISRGVFRSNKGILINADVNAAYQIIRKAGIRELPIKEHERVLRINVA